MKGSGNNELRPNRDGGRPGGTIGGVWEVGGVLVVSQTSANQDNIAALLEWLQRVYGERP